MPDRRPASGGRQPATTGPSRARRAAPRTGGGVCDDRTVTPAAADVDVPARAHHLPAALVPPSARPCWCCCPRSSARSAARSSPSSCSRRRSSLAWAAGHRPAGRRRGDRARPGRRGRRGGPPAAAARPTPTSGTCWRSRASPSSPGCCTRCCGGRRGRTSSARWPAVLLLVCAVCGLAVLLRLPDAAGGDRPRPPPPWSSARRWSPAGWSTRCCRARRSPPASTRGVLGLLVALLAGVAVAVLRHTPGGLGDTLSSVTGGLVPRRRRGAGRAGRQLRRRRRPSGRRTGARPRRPRAAGAAGGPADRRVRARGVRPGPPDGVLRPPREGAARRARRRCSAWWWSLTGSRSASPRTGSPRRSRSAASSPGRRTSRIEGWPFLTQAVGGDYEDVRIRLDRRRPRAAGGHDGRRPAPRACTCRCPTCSAAPSPRSRWTASTAR